MGLSLEELRRKINLELDETSSLHSDKFKESEEDLDGDIPDEEVESPSKKVSPMKSRVRIDNQDKIAGMIDSLNYRISFTELSDKLNEIEGMSTTRSKAKRIFNIVRAAMGF